MAALERPSRNSKLKKIRVENVLCTICQSILIEPVTLPCSHSFCSNCFKGTIENNALCCPLCRKRIGSWLRTAKRQKKLINKELWNSIQKDFSNEIAQKYNGTDAFIVEEKPAPILCNPGEIRSEYEAALQRAREERLLFEQKHAAETELLIRKLQQEDKIGKAEIPRRSRSKIHTPVELNVDQTVGLSVVASPKHLTPSTREHSLVKHDVESLIVRKKLLAVESPVITDDNSSVCSNDTSTSCTTQAHSSHQQQPASSSHVYANFFKDYLDRKLSRVTGIMHDNNKKVIETSSKDKVPVVPSGSRSLPVSLPYASLMSRGLLVGAAVDTDSVDSMKQEFCCFKPIDSTPTTIHFVNNKATKGCSPVRVVGVRPHVVSVNAVPGLTGPQHLHRATTRHQSSAFVCLLKIRPSEQNLQHTDIPTPKKSRNRHRSGNSLDITAAPTLLKRVRPASKEREIKPNPATLLDKLLSDPQSDKQPEFNLGSMQKKFCPTSPEKVDYNVTNPTLDSKLITSSRIRNSEFNISSAKLKDAPTAKRGFVHDKSFPGILTKDNGSPKRLTRRTSAARKEYYEQNGFVSSGDKLEQLKNGTISNRGMKTQLDEDLELALKLDAEWNSPVAKTRRYTFQNDNKPKRQLALTDMMVGGKMKV